MEMLEQKTETRAVRTDSSDIRFGKDMQPINSKR